MTGKATGIEYRILSREGAKQFIESLDDDERFALEAGYDEYCKYLAEVAANFLNYEAANYVRKSGDAFIRLYIAQVDPRDVIELPVFAIFPRDGDMEFELTVQREALYVKEKRPESVFSGLVQFVRKFLKR